MVKWRKPIKFFCSRIYAIIFSSGKACRRIGGALDNLRKRYSILILSSLWLLMAFTDYGPPTVDYYPLKQGMIWVYHEQLIKPGHWSRNEITPRINPDDKLVKLTWTVLGTREIDGRRGTEFQVIKEISDHPRKIKSVFLVADDGAGPYYSASSEGQALADPDSIREPKAHPLSSCSRVP